METSSRVKIMMPMRNPPVREARRAACSSPCWRAWSPMLAKLKPPTSNITTCVPSTMLLRAGQSVTPGRISIIFIIMQPNKTHSAMRPAYVLVTSQASVMIFDFAIALSLQLAADRGCCCCDGCGIVVINPPFLLLVSVCRLSDSPSFTLVERTLGVCLSDADDRQTLGDFSQFAQTPQQ